MVKLNINTSDSETIHIELEKNGKVIDKLTSSSKFLKSEAVIPMLDKLLAKNKLTLTSLNEVHLFEGPGSFTGLRVGVSIANALGYLLGIPVNGRKIGELASPVYN